MHHPTFPNGQHPDGQHSTDLEFKVLADTLIILRELPRFYFQLEAKYAGRSPDFYRRWIPAEWPYSRIQDHQSKLAILHTMIRVQLRIWPYPDNETYWESHDQMVLDIRDLLARGTTTHRVALAIGTTYNSIPHLMARKKDDGIPPNHCPWHIRQKLKETEEQLFQTRSPMRQRTKMPRQEEASQTLRTGVRHILQEQTITLRGNCTKCQSNWTHLTFNGNSQLIPFHHEYQCRICGRTDFSPFPHIPRMAPCAHCSAPWTTLDLTAMQPDGQQIRTCRNCQRENQTPPPAVTQLHKHGGATYRR